VSVIDRDELLVDIKLPLPSSNVFTDAEILVLAERVISTVGDDDEYYEEVVCKSLKSIAINNRSKSVSSSGLRSRKIEDIPPFD
jgi:hypothetical protein